MLSEVTLYTVVCHGGRMEPRCWLISLAMDVDIHYWSERKAERLIVCEPRLHIGQATMLQELFRIRSWEASGVRGLAVSLPLIMKEAERAADGWQWRNVMKRSVTFREVALAGRKGRYECMNGWDKGGTVVYLEALQTAIRGRALIPGEIVRLLRDAGMQDAEQQWTKLVQAAVVHGFAEMTNGVQLTYRKPHPLARRALMHRCRRCGSGEQTMHRTPCAVCGEVCTYCEACLTMGRVRFCTPLVIGTGAVERVDDADHAGDTDHADDAGKEVIHLIRGDETLHVGARREVAQGGRGARALEQWIREEPDRWGLSLPQKDAVTEVLRFVASRQSNPRSAAYERHVDRRQSRMFLLWAVTGAGKTEMIFPVIAYALFAKKRILIATPRQDVVKELHPRMKRAFPEAKMVVLYGGSEERFATGDIVLATTHQLLRFGQAFDIVIIDEMDAFPFRDNAMLEYAAEKVCRPHGCYIYLSATPPVEMQKRARRGRIAYAMVPVRFHGYPLPIPQCVRIPPIRQVIGRGKLPGKLRRRLDHSLERGAQVFMFVPRISWIEPLVELLGRSYPDYRVEGASSIDPMRGEKVLHFRDRAVRILVTTTILERGVTVGCSDVYILDADASLFDEASLVQMAGRAGRSANDPAGSVYFCGEQPNQAQKRAIRHIRRMNRIARSRGYMRKGE